jgi:IMP dehydrogenase
MYTQNIPIALSYDDVLLVPQYSDIESRSDISLKTYLSPRITLTLPITSAPMADVSGVKMAIALNKSGGLAYLPRFCSIDEEANMVSAVKKAGCQVGAAVGCKDDYLKRAEALVKAKVDALLLDVANGHLQKAVDATKKLKENFGKEVDIHSGLVATKEGLINLFEAGADCVHVGIGGGSICTTRIMTGCGVPNISSIFECAPEARKRNRSIVIDGGIKNSGDIVKACAAGASAVRAGFLLAGFDESPGKLVIINGKKYKSYKGSASLTEKKNHIKKRLSIT